MRCTQCLLDLGFQPFLCAVAWVDSPSALMPLSRGTAAAAAAASHSALRSLGVGGSGVHPDWALISVTVCLAWRCGLLGVPGPPPGLEVPVYFPSPFLSCIVFTISVRETVVFAFLPGTGRFLCREDRWRRRIWAAYFTNLSCKGCCSFSQDWTRNDKGCFPGTLTCPFWEACPPEVLRRA